MRVKPLFLSFSLVLSGQPFTAAAASTPKPDTVVFAGMCDASAAIPLDARSFAVANDEDNILRVYDTTTGGPPLRMVDLSPALPLRQRTHSNSAKPPKPAKPGKKSPEADLEAATTLGDAAYWLTSHGLNSKGKRKDARFIFFATSLPQAGQPVAVLGQPYLTLLEDLMAAPSLRPFNLPAASERPPKADGGLNLEGLTATPDGQAMLVGFRNPIPNRRALLVPLLNPREMMNGQHARFGEPVLLDLGGQGIRALSWWRGSYLIVAGEHGEGGTSHIYTWDGRGPAARVSSIDLDGFNPEAFFTPENRDDIMVFSDDGGVTVDGVRCKDLADPAQRRFRGVRLRLPAPNSSP